MTDPLELANQKIQVMQNKQESHKREIWNRVKNEAPEVAYFIKDFERCFGKHEKVAIWLDCKRVL